MRVPDRVTMRSLSRQEVVIGAAIIFAGPMVSGYAIMDEFALLVLAGLIFLRKARERLVQRLDWMDSLHWLAYCFFLIHLFISCLRGVEALADWRILRFALMFSALGVVGYFRYSAPPNSASEKTMVWLVAWAGVIYFFIYIAAGLIAEWGFGVDRFSLQGHYWSGTATAVFPAFVMAPALLLSAAEGDAKGRRLFWIGYGVLTAAAFYYQSRSVWLLLIGCLITGVFLVGPRRTGVASGIFVVFILIFPWDWTVSLTPKNLLDVSRYSDNQTSIVCRKFGRFTAALVGSIFPDIDKKLFGCPEYEYKLINDNLKQIPSLPPAFSGSVAPSQVPPLPPAFSGSVALSKSQADADRKIANIAAIRYVADQSLLTLMFGSGYYTHRYLLIPSFQLVAKQYDYVFPDVYKQIVRTAVFAGMLVDVGLVGMVLLLALVLFTMARLWSVGGSRSLPALVGLGLIVISLFVSFNYDVVLLYLALMPGGALLGLFPHVQTNSLPISE